MNTLSSSILTSERIYLNREYFLEYVRLANSFEYADAPASSMSVPTLDVEASLGRIKDDIRSAVRETGVCLVRTRTMDFHTVLEQQTLVFGPNMPDSTGASVSKIAVTPGRKFYASSSIGQPLHSDDAHLASPPRLISLYCQEQSVHGGLTTLAMIGRYLEAVREAIPEECFAPDAIAIKGSAGVLSRALIISQNQLLCPFPSILTEVSGTKSVIDLYKRIMAWCHIPDNQIRLRLTPGDLLFLDNHRVLHGRTSFPEMEPRTLLRVSFGDTKP